MPRDGLLVSLQALLSGWELIIFLPAHFLFPFHNANGSMAAG